MSSNDPIQQVINQVTDSGGVDVAIPGTPQVFHGANERDVIEKLVQAQQNATEAIRQARAEAAQTRQEMEGLRSQIPPPPPPSASDAEKQNYYQTWAQDPDKALDLQLSKRFGVPPEQVGEVLRKNFAHNVANNAADEFKSRTPGYPEDDLRAAQLMDQALRASFGNGPEALTANNLIVVYHDLVNQGLINPAIPQTSRFVQQNTVMPSIRGGGAPPNQDMDTMRQIYDMPLEKLKEVIDRAGQQTRR